MYKKITLDSREYYLIPVGDFKKEPLTEPKKTSNPIDDFVVTTPPVRESEIKQGEIPQAEGKPSEYRNRFIEQSLTGNDVNVENTANLSSLKRREGNLGPDGKEESFYEVSF